MCKCKHFVMNRDMNIACFYVKVWWEIFLLRMMDELWRLSYMVWWGIMCAARRLRDKFRAVGQSLAGQDDIVEPKLHRVVTEHVARVLQKQKVNAGFSL